MFFININNDILKNQQNKSLVIRFFESNHKTISIQMIFISVIRSLNLKMIKTLVILLLIYSLKFMHPDRWLNKSIFLKSMTSFYMDVFRKIIKILQIK